jgi:hypothetical protein
VTTIHAWFSAEEALLHGSSVFRKPSGSTVNVTRMNVDQVSKGSYRADEKYVGEVIGSADGGCVVASRRVNGITGPDRATAHN